MSERLHIDDLESNILVCPNQIFTYRPSPQSAEQPSLLPHFLIFQYTLQLFQTIVMRLLGKGYDLWAQYTHKSAECSAMIASVIRVPSSIFKSPS
jgi:hypothetical protein